MRSKKTTKRMCGRS